MFGRIWAATLLVGWVTTSSGEHLGPAEVIPYNTDNIAIVEKLHDMNPIIEIYALNINTNLSDIARGGSAILSKIAAIKTQGEVCLTKGCAKQLDLIRRKVERGVYYLKAIRTTGNKRQKRFWAGAGEFLHDSFGVLTENDLQMIQEANANLRTQQKEIIQQISKEKLYLMQSFEHLKGMAEVINNISAVAENRTNLSKDIAERTDQNSETTAILEDAANDFLESTIACIELLTTRRISGKFLDVTHLDSIYADIQSKILKDAKIAVDSLLELSIQRKSTNKIVDNILTTTFEIPIVSNETWQIFHIKHGLVVEDKKIIMLHIDDHMIARTPNNWTTKIASMNDCYTTGSDILACHIKEPITHKPSCAHELITTGLSNSSLCKEKIIAAKIQSDVIVRINDEQVLVVPESLTNVSVNCLQKWSIVFLIKRPSIIKVNEPCTVKVNDLMFMEAPVKLQETDVIIQSEIKIDTTYHGHISDAPPFPRYNQEKLESLDQLGKKIKDLNDEDINTPFYHRIYRRSSPSQITWAIVITIIILIAALYVYIKCPCLFCCC